MKNTLQLLFNAFNVTNHNISSKYIHILIALIVIIIIIFCIIFIIIGGIIMGHNMIYHKPKLNYNKIELYRGIYKKKWLKNQKIYIFQILSSIKPHIIRIYMFIPKKSNNKAIIFHHGVSSNYVVGLKHAKYYLKLGYTFFCYDSRGHGDARNNSYCTYGIYEKYDLYDVVKRIIKYNFNEIFLHGESMGGAIVLNYAVNFDDKNYVNGYIVDSAYVDFQSIAWKNLKMYLSLIFVWMFYPIFNFYYYYKSKKFLSQNNIQKKLKKINNPVLAFHSYTDSAVPISEYYKILNNISNIKGYTVNNIPHCLISVCKHKEFWNEICNFLKISNEKG